MRRAVDTRPRLTFRSVGGTFSVTEPAVAVLSTGSVCFPLNRPIWLSITPRAYVGSWQCLAHATWSMTSVWRKEKVVKSWMLLCSGLQQKTLTCTRLMQKTQRLPTAGCCPTQPPCQSSSECVSRRATRTHGTSYPLPPVHLPAGCPPPSPRS